MFAEYFENVRTASPLIHNITNYVTVNDVANILLACGASPIMADDPDEVEDITTICAGLNINIGTLNARTISSMMRAGKKASELNHARLLDPVGAGASGLRTKTAVSLMEEIQFTAIKGNMSEMKALALGSKTTRGVDADAADAVTKDNLDEMTDFAKQYAKTTGSIIVITGAIDLAADAERCFVIYNGRPEMERITGCGCQLAGLMSAFLAANPEDPLTASAAATAAMGLAGEIAHRSMLEWDGNATYRNRIIDTIYNMDGQMLDSGARYEIR